MNRNKSERFVGQLAVWSDQVLMTALRLAAAVLSAVTHEFADQALAGNWLAVLGFVWASSALRVVRLQAAELDQAKPVERGRTRRRRPRLSSWLR